MCRTMSCRKVRSIRSVKSWTGCWLCRKPLRPILRPQRLPPLHPAGTIFQRVAARLFRGHRIETGHLLAASGIPVRTGLRRAWLFDADIIRGGYAVRLGEARFESPLVYFEGRICYIMTVCIAAGNKRRVSLCSFISN